MAIDPTNPLVLYAATEGAGVFRSLDQGLHWSPLNSGIASEDLAIFGLAMDPTNSAILYTAGPRGGYKTTTGGR